MTIKTAFVAAAALVATVAGAVAFGTMSMIATGNFAGANGTYASANLNIPMEGATINPRMGVVDVFSPKGSLLLSVRPHTVTSVKYDTAYAAIEGIATIRTAGSFVKAPYLIEVYDASEDNGIESDQFEIVLAGFRTGPVRFSGTAVKGNIAFVPVK